MKTTNITLDHLLQDIESLPEEAQSLLVDFVQFLKERHSKTAPSSLQAGKTYEIISPLNSHKAAQTLSTLLEQQKL